MSKQNDLILTLLANPQFDTEDFQKVGLSANNTSIEDENTYLNSDKITKNPLFQNESGEFDKNKFHSVYLGASKMMQDLSIDTPNPQTVYSKYNIWAPVSQRDMSPQFELVKAANPDRITKSMIVLGQNGNREYTPQEIAQSQQIFDSNSGKYIDSPEDLFSFKKLFSDPIGFFTDNFGSNKVMAQYETDVDINGNKRGDVNFDENLIEHIKGEYMLNENGTYYYRTLKEGENIYGKQLLHYSDILTREGSALNSIDFLDSDDIEKSGFGTFVKDAALIGAMFIPGGVGTAIAGATIFQQAAGLGATLGKIALQDSDNSTLNWIEGLSEATNPLVTRSEYSSGDKMWTIENLLGMVADVVAQLYQQRLIFKWAPMITKGKWGMSEEAQTALKEKYITEIASKNKSSLDAIISKYGQNSVQALKGSKELTARAQIEAAALVEDYMKEYYKSGEQLSKAYMTILTVNDIYSEAKEAGASDFDASLITAGYAAMEYALLSTDIGKWILPELRSERLHNKAIVNALTKDTLETFKKLGNEATTSEVAKRNYIQRLVNWGKNQAKAVMTGEFNTGLGKRAAFEADSGLLKAGIGSIFAGASGEAIEETSEEVLADFSRVLFNGLQELKGNKDVKMKKSWEDEHLFDRYAMSFLGGFIGGGISSAAFDFSQTRKSLNMDYNKAVQELIWKTRNNDLNGIYKILNNEEIGNKNLSASKFVEGENGERIWKQGTAEDNQDVTIKNLAKRQIKLLQDTLDAHGGNMSDEHLIDQQTLRDIRYRVLHNSTTAGKYIQKYNQTLGQLIEKTTELRNLNSIFEKVKSGETDEKERTQGESKESSARRKKLEQEIKELDEQIDNFNTGKLAPLFMTSALLETTPFISEVFMRSSFKTFAESKAKTKYENIPEGEIKTYWDQYQAHLRTTKKDDLDFATEGYLSLQKLIKQNFEEAKKVAQDSVNNETVNSLLKNSQQKITKLLIESSWLEDDAWQERFQNFVTDNPLTEKFITNIQLIRNTVNETKKQADSKYNEAKAKYDEQLANGEIEESVYQSLIRGLETEKQETYTQVERGQDIALSEINTDMLVEQANQLADNFISLGYINGAIKDTVVSRLQELYDQLNQQQKYFESYFLMEDEEEFTSKIMEDEERLNKITEGQNKINRVLPELQNKIEQIKSLKYTPILQNLDWFALNLKSISVSQVLEQLGNAIQTNKTNIGSFTFGQDIHHAINEADRVIDLYIAALEGARTDTVDPFRINPSTGETSENLWGINKVLNEVHAKAPKIENDTWEDLPEIDGDTANMMLLDARSIKSLLQSYKKLFDINRGQKLEIQSRVGARASYLLYNKINRLLTNGDFPDKDKDGKEYEGVSELKQSITNLSFFNENVKDKKKEDWNINLSIDQQIALEKDKLALETAIFDFFNKNQDKDWESLFSQLLFNLGDSRTTLLTEAADDIDESSFIGYLVSKIAINSTDFYSKYKDMLKNGDKKIAPLLGQEIGVQLHLGNILNGSIVTKAIQAYRNSIYKHFKNLSFEDRVKFLRDNGVSDATAYLLSTQRGFEKIFGSYDLVPQYSNITFSDGIAGSGKTSAIMATVNKFLQTYYSSKFTKIWTIHGGDSDTETTFAEGLRKSIGLAEDGTMTFNKKTLMDKITPDRVLTTNESGKSYQFKDDDYKLLNGKIVSNWKLKSYTKEELPDVIIIDEAQQFTQLDLLTIDKFARENGISVIMSGDLQQSQMSGEFKLSPEDVTEINRELSEKNILINGNKLQFNKDNTPVTLKLSRNQVLHTPKIGTSMRTENNQKNMNAATIQAVMEAGSGQISLHYYIDDSTIAGDYWAGENEDISPMLDKMIANLKEGEKINFAYSSEDSEIYKKLKANSTYWNKINPIKGVALGQEGNYWILDIDTNQDVGDYLQDLYTGITRAKKASILVSKKTPVDDITLDNIQDSETHPEKYSEKAVEKFVDKRVKVLEGALPNTSNDIPYNPRTGTTSTESPTSEPPTPGPGPTPSTPEPITPSPTLPSGPTSPINSEPNPSNEPSVVPPISSGPTPSNGEHPVEKMTLEGKSMDQLAKELVDNHLVNIPARGLTTKNLYNVPMIDFFHRKIVLVDINGLKIPFYLSTGFGGKVNVESGKWYPVWGIDPQEGWINKTNETEINNFYGSPLLKAIAEALDNKYQNSLPDNIPLTDEDYNPMYDVINQTTGFSSRSEGSKGVRDRYNRIIPLLHESIGYIEEQIPEIEEEVQPEDIEEKSVSNEQETQGKLSDANREDNSATFDEVEISGFSKKDFNFYLFSNATFELGLGQNLINPDGTINVNSLINNKRIDSLNGVIKLFGPTHIREGIEFLAEVRDRLMSIEDKSTLEKEINTLINDKLRKLDKSPLGNLYIRFAIKTTESNVLNNKYDKAQKGNDESLPFARAQVDPNSESNFVNNRSLVAIIGENEDLLEIPLLMLNNPITIITQLESGQYKYPQLATIYTNAYNQAYTYAQTQPIRDKRGYAQIEALKVVKNTFNTDAYKGLSNLIEMYLDTHRKVSFIKDQNWTIGKNLHTFGPQLNLKRGQKNPDYNAEYIQEDRWISLDELRSDPQLKITGIYNFIGSSEYEDEAGNPITIVSQPKHPFVLYTDAFYAHDGKTQLNSDDAIIEEFLYQKEHPEAKQTIKIVYVLPPKFTIKEYIDSLIGFMVEGKKGVLGNQRTPLKVLEGLIYDANGNINPELIDVFKHSLGEETGQLVYDKVKGIIDSMKGLSLQEQIKLLTNDTPQRWNINGFGLNTDVQLYQQLQNVIKQLVQPSSINILGNINHKGSSDERISNTQKLSEIFAKSGLSLFYQTKGSKDQSQIKFGRFSPIQEVEDGSFIKNDYLSEQNFTINGNLSTSTFMANEEFNNIIEDILKEYHPNQFTTPTNDGRQYFDNNYSGFNSQSQTPSISQNILNKLNKFGLTTNVIPTTNNDSSIELKRKIEEEINSKKSDIKAIVLPDGELIIGKNNLFTGKEVEFKFDSNPFESQQNYQFDAIIDGEEYNVVYSETNSGKMMELTPKNSLQQEQQQQQIDYSKYSVNPNLDINKAKELLNIIASSSNRMNQFIQRILLTEDDKLAETITNFLNQDMIKMLIKTKNLDLSQFIDILNFEQTITQDNQLCNLSIKIQFI